MRPASLAAAECAISLAHFYFLVDGRDDPVADFVKHEQRIVEFVIKDLGPHDAGGACLGQFNRDDNPVARTANRTAGHIIDVQHPPGLLRTDAPLMQCEYGPLRDDEEAPQFGEPSNHVVSETVCCPAP
jgi:hypothetical protein